jgi:hypothetical protein
VIEAFEKREPFRSPLLRPIAPSTRPLAFTPRVPNDEELLFVVLSGLEDGVSVRRNEAVNLYVGPSAARSLDIGEKAAEEVVLHRLSEEFGPEALRVEDVLKRN